MRTPGAGIWPGTHATPETSDGMPVMSADSGRRRGLEPAAITPDCITPDGGATLSPRARRGVSMYTPDGGAALSERLRRGEMITPWIVRSGFPVRLLAPVPFAPACGCAGDACCACCACFALAAPPPIIAVASSGPTRGTGLSSLI